MLWSCPKCSTLRPGSHPTRLPTTERVLAGQRWKYDRFFRRDGRHISSCNWFTVAPGDCIDLWKPLHLSADPLTPAQALANIIPVRSEFQSQQIVRDDKGQPVRNRHGEMFQLPKPVTDAAHLLDDYALSRNIAEHGLKFTTVMKLMEASGDRSSYMWHAYNIFEADKIKDIRAFLQAEGLLEFLREQQLLYKTETEGQVPILDGKSGGLAPELQVFQAGGR